MPLADQSALLRRKMETTPGVATAPAPLTPEASCLKAVVRAGFIAAGLKVTDTKVALSSCDGATALGNAMSGASMVIPCAAPDGAEGFFALSGAALTALVEKTTTGRIANAEGEERVASAIDRLLCQAFLERFMDAWRDLVAGSPVEVWLAGYELEDRMLTADVVTLSATDLIYSIYSVTAVFDGIRPVEIWVALPEHRHTPQDVGETPDSARTVGDWAKDWRAAVLESPAELEAILCRLDLSLEEVQRWQPGDRVPIPASSLSTVSLGRRNGPSVATARLGQARGVRALRLNEISAQRSSRATPPPKPSPGAAPDGFDAAPGIPTQSAPAVAPPTETPAIGV